MADRVVIKDKKTVKKFNDASDEIANVLTKYQFPLDEGLSILATFIMDSIEHRCVKPHLACLIYAEWFADRAEEMKIKLSQSESHDESDST